VKVPHSWLAEFVPGLPGPRETAAALVRAGLPPASVLPYTSAYSDVVVGKVVSAGKHPNADRLSLCEVESGGEKYAVVCGAPNVKAGAKYPFALPGARLPGGKTITAAVIRGVASNGMLCSAAELGMGTDAAGILEIDASLPTGEPFVPKPEDWVLDVEVTPNRGDALSIVGVARSVAAILGKPWKYPWKIGKPREGPSTRPSASLRAAAGTAAGAGWSVRVEDKDGCGLYSGRLLAGVKIAPSPEWMQKRLTACGLRPISNVVDATNYVLLELGHPLHSFDAARVVGKKIIVRRAKAGERMRTLDGTERKLAPEVLVIADGSGPVAVAGVMGGASSEISASTTAVLLEAAWFDPVRVRRGSNALGLKSESSYRFERGVDPGGVTLASERATRLIMETAGAKIASPLLCAKGKLPARTAITVTPAGASAALGITVSGADTVKFCKLIGAEARKGAGGKFAVTPPSWRLDIREEADLLEEFAILAGYDRIPATMPAMSSGPLPRPAGEKAMEAVESALRGAGFSEVKTFSFISAADAGWMAEKGAATGESRVPGVELRNPMGEEMGYLRPMLLPGLLRAAAFNMAREAPGALLFEIGRVFRDARGGAPEEFDSLALVAAGREQAGVHGAERPRDFADIKGALEAAAAVLGVRLSWEPGGRAPFAGGQCAIISGDGKEAGAAGVLSPEAAKAFDLPAGSCAAEVDLRVLLAAAGKVSRIKEPPRFPAVRRDIAMVVGRGRQAAELLAAVEKAGAPLLESVEVFDAYEGKQVPEGMKSLAFRLAFRSPERTLKEEEADKVLQGIISALEAGFGAKIRAA